MRKSGVNSGGGEMWRKLKKRWHNFDFQKLKMLTFSTSSKSPIANATVATSVRKPRARISDCKLQLMRRLSVAQSAAFESCIHIDDTCVLDAYLSLHS